MKKRQAKESSSFLKGDARCEASKLVYSSIGLLASDYNKASLLGQDLHIYGLSALGVLSADVHASKADT